MIFIQWCELFRIGHPTIDEQHQELFRITNRFHEAMGHGHDRHLIAETLNRLIAYAEMHFGAEEKIAEHLGFAKEERAAHHSIHEGLMLDIFALNQRFAEGHAGSLEELEDFLVRWLILHVLIEDRKYRARLA